MRAEAKTPEQVEALRAFAQTMRDPAKYSLLVTLTYRLGLRPVELAQLELEQFRDGGLRIQAGHTKGKLASRTIPVPASVLAEVHAFMQGRRGRVFQNRYGEDMDAAAITKAIKRFYSEAGQTGSSYCGRRTLLTSLVEQDVNILVVQGIAGHRSPLTTLSYVGVTQQMMARALGA